MKSALGLGGVIETVGVNLLSFLDPKQLFILSSVSHYYHEELIHRYILGVCVHQLQKTIKLGVGSNYLVEFTEGQSFSSTTQLWDHIFVKITPTLMQEYCIDGDEQTSIISLRATAEREPNIKLTCTDGHAILTASCNIQQRHRDVAQGLVRYIIDRDACKNDKRNEYYSFVNDWLHYLICVREISIQFWEWDILCKGRREFGKGVVFMYNAEVVEIRLRRFY